MEQLKDLSNNEVGNIDFIAEWEQNMLKQQINLKQATVEEVVLEDQETDGKVLPFGKDDRLTAINSILRCQLFAGTRIQKKDKDKYYERELTPYGNENIKMTVIGRDLDVEHGMIFNGTLSLVIKEFNDTGKTTVRFSGSDFLINVLKKGKLKNSSSSGNKASVGKNQIDYLNQKLSDLTETSIHLSGNDGIEEIKGAISLISSWVTVKNLKSGRDVYEVEFSEKLLEFLCLDSFSYIDPEEVNELKSPLAKWMNIFYSTQRSYPIISVQEIKRLSGNEHVRQNSFNTKLNKSLKELITSGFISKYEYTKNNFLKLFK